MGPETKVQVNVDPAVGSAGRAEMVAVELSCSMASNSLLLRGTAAALKLPPVIATDSTTAATVSLRSGSVTINEPVVLIEAFVSLMGAATSPAATSRPLITGESLVPVRVMTTRTVVAAAESVPLAPLLSVRVRV